MEKHIKDEDKTREVVIILTETPDGVEVNEPPPSTLDKCLEEALSQLDKIGEIQRQGYHIP